MERRKEKQELFIVVQYSNIIQQSTQITIKNKTRKTYI